MDRKKLRLKKKKRVRFLLPNIEEGNESDLDQDLDPVDVEELKVKLEAEADRPWLENGSEIPRMCFDCFFGFDTIEVAKAHFTEVHGKVYRSPKPRPKPPPVLVRRTTAAPEPDPFCPVTVLDGMIQKRAAGFPHKCYKPECGRSFQSIAETREHIISVHGGNPRLIVYCLTCDQLFPSKELLLRHETAVHSISFKCAARACGKEFSTQLGLQTHVQSVHEKEKPGMMQLELPKLAALLEPAPVRPAGRMKVNYACYCSKTFRTDAELQAHAESGHRHTCQVDRCGKGFSSGRNLNRHISDVHRPRK